MTDRVTIERETLRQLYNELEGVEYEFDPPKRVLALMDKLRAALAAQPAEQELTQFEADLIESVGQMMRGEVARVWHPAQPAEPVEPVACESCEELQQLCDRLADLLTRTAAALKGPPPPLTLHDWSDLPDVADDVVTLARLKPYWKEPAPAAVPLTRAAIDAIWSGMGSFTDTQSDYRLFARAIERAHGIAAGEKP